MRDLELISRVWPQALEDFLTPIVNVKKSLTSIILLIVKIEEWSPGRALNPRPAAYKAAALPAELPGHLGSVTFLVAHLYEF